MENSKLYFIDCMTVAQNLQKPMEAKYDLQIYPLLLASGVKKEQQKGKRQGLCNPCLFLITSWLKMLPTFDTFYLFAICQFFQKLEEKSKAKEAEKAQVETRSKVYFIWVYCSVDVLIRQPLNENRYSHRSFWMDKRSKKNTKYVEGCNFSY